VMQMDEVTQQNAALVEEAAAAARAMQEQADELERQIRYFRVQGGAAAKPRPAPARAVTLATKAVTAGAWTEF